MDLILLLKEMITLIFLIKTDQNFDIIFADPPYLFSEDQYFELLSIIKQKMFF